MEKYNAYTSTTSEENYKKRMADISNGISTSGFFDAPEIIHAHWEKNYTADEYFGFASTGNVFVQNPDDIKQAFHEALNALAEKHGGIINRHYICELYLARKKSN